MAIDLFQSNGYRAKASYFRAHHAQQRRGIVVGESNFIECQDVAGRHLGG